MFYVFQSPDVPANRKDVQEQTGWKKYNNAGATADLDRPGPNPLADMNPSSQIWTPHQTFLATKHRLYQIW